MPSSFHWWHRPCLVKIDGFPGMAHGTYGILIGVEAFAHLDREIFALRGQGLGQGLGQEAERLMLSTRVRDRMGPDGMGRDGKGWWWMMVDDGFSHVFSMFFHVFFWNLSDFVAGEAAEQRRRDLGSHSNGDGHCHAAVDQSSSGTGPYLGTTCGNRPSGPVPKKKKRSNTIPKFVVHLLTQTKWDQHPLNHLLNHLLNHPKPSFFSVFFQYKGWFFDIPGW